MPVKISRDKKWIFLKGYKVLLIYWSKGKIAQPQGFQGKNKGVTETDNSSMVGRGGFEPPKSMTTDLQSVPFGRSGIFPYWIVDQLVIWWAFRDSNPRPTGYEPVALTN